MEGHICSFDVFDTVLTRCVFQPSDLFMLLGYRLQRLGYVFSAKEFTQKRLSIEREARRQINREEVTLVEIYDRLALLYGWTKYQTQCAMKEELLCEECALVPIARMKEQVIKEAERGRRILFISDTYLPEDFIIRELHTHIPIKDFGLYLSSTTGLTKHSGHLFAYIAKREALEYENWQHQGDNMYSDILAPRKLGIKSLPVNYDSVTRYESTMAKAKPHMLASTLSGSMRATRLSEHFESAHDQDVWNLACDVVGPAFFGFCYWLLSSAVRDQVQRLYFVARDGQVLLKVARAIQQAVPEFSGIECRYLYGSRQAWHPAAISQIDVETLDWIFANTSFLSVNVVLERVGQSEQIPYIVQDVIKSCVPIESWGANLKEAERLALRSLFEQSKEIHQWIMDVSMLKRASVLAYLRQEGLFEDIKWAMVDIGWHGRLQNSLSRLLTLGEGYPQFGVLGYYWGLSSRSPYRPQDRQVAMANELPKSWQPILFYHAGLYEAFASADHGSVIGYVQSDSKWMPILRDRTTQELLQWGVVHLQEGVVRFATNFLRNWHQALNIRQYMSLVLSILKQFFWRPMYREVACLRERPMYECQTESRRLDLIPESSAWKIMAYWIRGKPYPEHGIWVHAVMAQQPLCLRSLMRCVMGWNKILVHVRHLVQHALAFRRGG